MSSDLARSAPMPGFIIDGDFREVPPPALAKPFGTDPAQMVRRVGLSHVAFFRAYLEGLDVTDAADRYLDFGRNRLKARAAQRWVLGMFLQAAQRFGQPGDARILRIPPERISATDGAEGVSFEAFTAAHDPDQIMSTDDLLDLFRVEYASVEGEAGAAARRQLRNLRLRRRQFAVLDRLRRIVVSRPEPSHHVMGWFDASAGLKLTDVGIHTLERLMSVIRARGYRWWTHVPGLGETRAQRMMAWLRANEQALGALPVHAVTPRRQWTGEIVAAIPAAAGIAPLERFVVPRELNGEQGVMRQERSGNLIRANNDLEAIAFWLGQFANKPETTYRKYRVEVERLVLWAIGQKRKAVSSLDLQDAEEYINGFLPNPEPAASWVMARNEPRHSEAWRPFRGPLTLRGREQTLQILRSMFAKLLDAGYLKANVFALVSRAKPFTAVRPDGTEVRESKTRRLLVEHSLTMAQWDYLLDFAMALPTEAHGALSKADERTVFILMFAYGTGLRQAELAAARTGDIRASFAKDASAGALDLVVTGKGNVTREVPLPADVLERLARYLASRGLPASPLDCPPQTPLIGKLGYDRRHTDGPLTGDHVAHLLKAFFRRAAEGAPDPFARRALLKASTHWMRHTFGTHGLANGMAVETVRETLGHASIETTSTYSSVEAQRRHEQTREFAERGFRRARKRAE